MRDKQSTAVHQRECVIRLTRNKTKAGLGQQCVSCGRTRQAETPGHGDELNWLNRKLFLLVVCWRPGQPSAMGSGLSPRGLGLGGGRQASLQLDSALHAKIRS